MNIAICDDEKVWQEELLKQLREYSIERHLDFSYTCFSDGKSLYDSEKKFDIIFMDFQMEGLDGIETSRKLRNCNSDSTIIFVSSYTHVAMDAYEVKAYRFLSNEILKNLKEVQKDLSSEKFFRCHKAYLVSFLHIKSHDNTDIVFDDESKAYISRKYLPSFRTAFHEYILKHNTGEV